MKVVAYITKCVPVIVEIDDKWKKMERWANEPTCEELDDYHDDNIDEFEEEVNKALETIGESSHKLHSIDTINGGLIMEDLQEY